jgi:hypothetical protein
MKLGIRFFFDSVENKPELLPVISEIYLFLAGCSDRSPEFQQLQNHKWIWTGNGFKTPDRIYLQTKPSIFIFDFDNF